MAYPYQPYQAYPQNYPQNMPQNYQQYQQPGNMSQQMQSGQQIQPQIQNGGFIPVRGEQEARSYPVAPGMSITFKDELAPYVYTKTMGFSSLDRPVFDRYRLVKEEPEQDAQEAQTDTKNSAAVKSPQYVLLTEFEAVKEQIDGIVSELDGLREQIAKQRPSKSKKEEKEEKDGEE